MTYNGILAIDSMHPELELTQINELKRRLMKAWKVQPLPHHPDSPEAHAWLLARAGRAPPREGPVQRHPRKDREGVERRPRVRQGRQRHSPHEEAPPPALVPAGRRRGRQRGRGQDEEEERARKEGTKDKGRAKTT